MFDPIGGQNFITKILAKKSRKVVKSGTIVPVEDTIVGAPTTAMAAATLPDMAKTGFLAGAGASAAGDVLGDID